MVGCTCVMHEIFASPLVTDGVVGKVCFTCVSVSSDLIEDLIGKIS